MRRRLAVAGLIVLVALACAAVWRAGRSEPALGERVMEVAATLRCPDCQGLSAAESPSKLAGAMRAEIGRRLTRGRDPESIREYFVRRYGERILLSPPMSGASAALWALPVVVLAAGCAAVVRTARRNGRGPERGNGEDRREHPVTPAEAHPSGAGVLPSRSRAGLAGAVLLTAACAGGVAAAALARPDGVPASAPAPVVSAAAPRTGEPPESPDSLLALGHRRGSLLALGRDLDARGETEQAVQVYREAVRLGPRDRTARRLLGLALIRAGRPAEAVPVLRPPDGRSPRDPDVLLALGAAEITVDPPAGRRTLRRFLRFARPGHPAIAAVRRVLREETA
ncbi:cytochrome c-type biogenesis protein CcmH [Streptosporangium sandarakinum]|uniref:cytochrome c-type biogenesis protein CcmH n=1 Tax=Streptosporangium sandarakinum TaxID=1260955 RepID=UPI0037BCE1E8